MVVRSVKIGEAVIFFVDPYYQVLPYLMIKIADCRLISGLTNFQDRQFLDYVPYIHKVVMHGLIYITELAVYHFQDLNMH